MRVLSLFSGCGGMDIGFECDFTCLKKSINRKMHSDWVVEDYGNWVKVKPTGFETVFANDIRPDAKAAWVSYFKKKYNNANEIYKLRSIVDLVKDYNNGENVFPNDIDVVTGGFPCQDFSIAGKRKGFKSEKSHNGGILDIDEPSIENRGQLYMWMRDVVSIVKPKVFIAENVKGLLSLEDVKTIIEHDFANAANGGYLVLPARVLQAANYGVPQSRERVIFFGFKKSELRKGVLEKLNNLDDNNEYDPYPAPTHNYDPQLSNSKLDEFVNCFDILNDLDEPDISRDISQTKYSKAKYMKKGQGNIEIKMDSVSPTIRSEHHGNIEYRRLSLENGGKHFDELEKGCIERRLTIRECARIQTFPDDYQFILDKTAENAGVSASDAYKIIGNAVPCVLGYNIAMQLAKNWSKYFK